MFPASRITLWCNIKHSRPCCSLQNCHSSRTLEVIQEAEQSQIQVEYATARSLEGTVEKELNSPEPHLLSMRLICHVKAFKGNACVFLGRNCCHILLEIPTIGLVFLLGLKRAAMDPLHSCAQVALQFQSRQHPYMLPTSHKIIQQDKVKLLN